MGTCKSCKWWDSNYHGDCCDFVDDAPELSKRLRFRLEVSADDDQGLECTLLTGPDFGCIHHQKK